MQILLALLACASCLRFLLALLACLRYQSPCYWSSRARHESHDVTLCRSRHHDELIFASNLEHVKHVPIDSSPPGGCACMPQDHSLLVTPRSHYLLLKQYYRPKDGTCWWFRCDWSTCVGNRPLCCRQQCSSSSSCLCVSIVLDSNGIDLAQFSQRISRLPVKESAFGERPGSSSPWRQNSNHANEERRILGFHIATTSRAGGNCKGYQTHARRK